ncbi:hypothetical protein BLOT_012380 [Blomia tropicalis]|nr:hypothetical protein BLOT_012380 [Blomia tropicalis]
MISHFLSKIKNRLPSTFQSKVLMTDMEITFSKAWQATFGGNTVYLYCAYHVKKAFNQQINTKINANDLKNQVRLKINKILTSLEEKEFNKEVLNFQQYCKSNNLFSFLEYFEKYYLNENSRYPINRWAYCKRKYLGINTNMIIETFHRKLKHLYMKGKRSKDVTTTLKFSTEIISDYEIDAITRQQRGYIPTKLRYLRKTHKDAENFPETELNEIFENHVKLFATKISEETQLVPTKIINNEISPCDISDLDCSEDIGNIKNEKYSSTSRQIFSNELTDDQIKQKFNSLYEVFMYEVKEKQNILNRIEKLKQDSIVNYETYEQLKKEIELYRRIACAKKKDDIEPSKEFIGS